VVVAKKEGSLNGKKLLLVQPLNEKKQPHGEPVVAMDAIGAGVGEHVFYVRGEEASLPFLPESVPVTAGIVGIIDYFHLGDDHQK